jgi:hypothetical protein
MLATVDTAGIVRVQDIHTHRTVATILAGDRGWRDYIDGPPLAFSRDNRLLAIGGSDGQVQIWRVRDAVLLRRLVHAKLGVDHLEPDGNGQRVAGMEPITGVGFGPDDSVLATTAANETGILWRVATGEQLATLCFCGSVRSEVRLFRRTPLAFSPNGRLLAIGAFDAPILLYTVPDGTPVTILGSGSGVAVDLAFSTGGERIAIAYREGVGLQGRSAVWSLADHDGVVLDIRGVAEPAPALAIAFAPDGNRVAGADLRGTVYVWEAFTGLELARRALPHPVSNISFDRRGDELRAFDLVTHSFVRWRGLPAGRTREAQRAAYAASQLPPPDPTVEISGRIVDLESGEPIAGALVSASGSAGRVRTDTNGVFKFQPVRVGQVTVGVRCPSRTPLGGPLYDTTVTLVWPQQPAVLSIRADRSLCAEPEFGRRQVTVRGLYSAGFEQSEFVPCADTGVAFAMLWGPGQLRRAWVESVHAGVQEFRWPAPDASGEPDYPYWYVEWSGTLVGPGWFGHMGGSPYELDITSITVVRPEPPDDCRLMGTVPGYRTKKRSARESSSRVGRDTDLTPHPYQRASELRFGTMQLAAGPVPALAPDSVPGWIYADSNLIHDKPQMSGSFPKNIIALLFKPGTSRALMQAAVDSVRGAVVGGLQPLNVYYVKVPSDTTGGPLFAAITKLTAMSQVELATPSVLSVSPDSPTLK